jgi:hypothetical protein
MDATHFDRLTRALSNAGTRRGVVQGIAAALGLIAIRFPEGAVAKKKHKHKKKSKLKRNEFGCVDVEGNCLGNSANCCSGACEDSKPKKGKKDKSTCLAHDAGYCTAESDSCTVGGGVACDTDLSGLCACFRTTGNAGFCADVSVDLTMVCRDCTTDSDCEAEFGTGAACVVFVGACMPTCPEGLHTACLSACATPF